MSSGTRKKISPADEAKLLMACRRRCCLCAHYKSDYSRKKGQIAHIDKDRTNAARSNLAFLCFDCHDEFDSKSSQSKNFTQKEVRLCKEKLESHYSSDKQLAVSILITLNLTPDEFERKRDKIQETLSKSVGREFETLNLQFGADTIDVMLDKDETHQLIQETTDGSLGQFEIRDLEIVDVRCDSARDKPAFAPYFGDDYLDEFVSKETILKTFESPTCQTHFDAEGNDCLYDEAVLSIFVKQFGTTTRQFAVLAFVLRDETTTKTERTFHPAIRIYRREFDYSESWTAVDYANAFAAKYGIGIHPFGRKIILPPDKITGTQTITKTIASTSFRGPYHYIAMQRKNFLGITHIYFILIVDIVSYAKSLRSHSFRLPKTFKKKLRTKDRYPSSL
ncbi:hypothetical protein [Novipirellula sp.]|uniref:hypothetical protein n=1 Tax=Novipirellula sp. TaxID=2795430 RepID=UPI0035651835